MTFNYRCCLQFNALYMFGHDENLLPIDASRQSYSFAELRRCRAGGFHPQHTRYLQRRFRGR